MEIPKPDGGKRMLGIPSVMDRVIQQACRSSAHADIGPDILGIEFRLLARLQCTSGDSPGALLRWTEKSQAHFNHRIKDLTGRSWGVSVAYRLHKLGQYLRGWVGYYGISQYYRPVPD